MKTPHTIKAILFDSGRVLNAPATGHWFISPNFWKYVDKRKYDCIEKKRISHAFHEAEKSISTQKLILTKEEEYQHLAANAVFIDDNLNNCIGAMKLGIHSILLCRNKYLYIWNKLKSIGKGYDVIYSLKDLDL